MNNLISQRVKYNINCMALLLLLWVWKIQSQFGTVGHNIAMDNFFLHLVHVGEVILIIWGPSKFISPKICALKDSNKLKMFLSRCSWPTGLMFGLIWVLRTLPNNKYNGLMYICLLTLSFTLYELFYFALRPQEITNIKN